MPFQSSVRHIVYASLHHHPAASLLCSPSFTTVICDLHRAHDEAKIAASFACLPCQLYGRVIAFKFLAKGSGVGQKLKLSTKRSRLQKFGANFAGAIPRLFDLIQDAAQLKRQCWPSFILFDSFSMI